MKRTLLFLFVILYITRAQLYLESFQDFTCSKSTIACAALGETCSLNSTLRVNYQGNSLVCLPEGSTCCRKGLYCIDQKCVLDNLGAACNVSDQCLQNTNQNSLPIGCVHGHCRVLANENDECDTSFRRCFGKMNCINGFCVGLNEGQNCTRDAERSDCKFELYCATNFVCQKRLTEGQKCSDSVAPCVKGYFCDISHSEVCTAEFSQTQGNSCDGDTDACDINNVCDSKGFCIAAAKQLVPCSSYNTCAVGTNCTCALGSGNGYCQGDAFEPCRQQEKDYSDCLVHNQCYPAYEKGSCAYAHCPSAWDAYLGCFCEFEVLQYGECSHDICDKSFALWQLVLIAIGGIVLLIIVTLCIAFAIRYQRNRQRRYARINSQEPVDADK